MSQSEPTLSDEVESDVLENLQSSSNDSAQFSVVLFYFLLLVVQSLAFSACVHIPSREHSENTKEFTKRGLQLCTHAMIKAEVL